MQAIGDVVCGSYSSENIDIFLENSFRLACPAFFIKNVCIFANPKCKSSSKKNAVVCLLILPLYGGGTGNSHTATLTAEDTWAGVFVIHLNVRAMKVKETLKKVLNERTIVEKTIKKSRRNCETLLWHLNENVVSGQDYIDLQKAIEITQMVRCAEKVVKN